jgi:hypothetical protein
MKEYDERVLLATRNLAAIKEGMKSYEARRQEQDSKLLILQEQVAGLIQQVQALQLSVAVLRATTHGRGSTV